MMRRPRYALPLRTLSPREMEVAVLSAQGDDVKDIMAKLGIAQSTVSGMRAKIYQKLELYGVPGSGTMQTKLAVHAVRNGWI